MIVVTHVTYNKGCNSKPHGYKKINKMDQKNVFSM